MKKNIFSVAVIFLLSYAPFLWYGPYGYQLIGSGDFLSIFNPSLYFQNIFYVYSQNFLSGVDISYLGAHIIPYFSFFWLLSLMHVTPYVTSLLFLGLILFVSQLSMYLYMSYIITQKIHTRPEYSNILSLFAAVLYGFSPYIVGLIEPGHILLLISYGFFPLILKVYDQYINARVFTLRYLIYLFLFFCLSATSYANVGSLAGIFVALLAYSIYSYLFEGLKPKILGVRLMVVGVTAYLSNAWWLTPYLLTIPTTIAVNESAGGIPSGFGDAAVKASVSNILFGRAEYLINVLPKFAKYIAIPTTLIYTSFIILTGLAVVRLRKNKYVLILLGMFLFGIYLTKSNQLPFFEPYKALYENISLLQIFRRPVSKFYWFPMFFYVALTTTGLATLMAMLIKHHMKTSGAIVLSLFLGTALYFAYLFVRTPQLTPFTIPSYYYDAGSVLKSETAERIFVLPGTYGVEPAFNESINNYYGLDFLWLIWPYSFIYPDSSNYTLAYPFKPIATSLVAAIRNNSSICNLASELDITHIIVRKDLAFSTKIEDSPQLLLGILKYHSDIVSVRQYGDNDSSGFTLLTLSPACRGSLIRTQGVGKAEMKFHKISPVEFAVSIKNLSAPTVLQYLTNYSDNWVLFPARKWLYIQSMKDIHKKIYHYANSWTLSPDNIRTHIAKEDYSINSDGSININLTLYYLPQLSAFIGWGLTGFMVVGGIIFLIIEKRRRYGAKN